MLSTIVRPLALLVTVAVTTGACATSGLSLLVDDRLTFTAPQDRATVTLPVTVSWTIDDFDIIPRPTFGASDAGEDASDRGTFGVFVDRSPQPPGEGLDWFVQDDNACQRDPGCPDPDWFTSRGIHTTAATSITIDALSRPNGDRRELHEVTIVLLDPAGRRIGESAWTIEFTVDRSPS